MYIIEKEQGLFIYSDKREFIAIAKKRSDIALLINKWKIKQQHKAYKDYCIWCISNNAKFF